MGLLLEQILSKVEKHNITSDKVVKAVQYLRHYGYLAKNDQITLVDVVKAANQFVDFFHLEATADIFSPKIISAMEAHRCGVADIMEARTSAAKWKFNELTYYTVAYDTDLSQQDWNDICDEALASWARVANLKFKRVNSKSQANLLFDIGQGRGDDFDGPSGTLAWAQLPGSNYSGQLLMKFDTDETWVKDSNQRGILLLNVAAHEFGHMLGLDHSRVQAALMAPYYSPMISKPQKTDDVSRIVNLYGQPIVVNVPGPTPKPNLPPTNPSVINISLSLEGKLLSADITGHRVMKK